MRLFLGLVETAAPKAFVLSAFPGMVGLMGFVVGMMKGFVYWTGLIGAGVFTFVGPLPFARFAHVLPQYGCSMTPSLYLGLLLQYLGR